MARPGRNGRMGQISVILQRFSPPIVAAGQNFATRRPDIPGDLLSLRAEKKKRFSHFIHTKHVTSYMANKEELQRKIGELLAEINEQYDTLGQTGGAGDTVSVDLFEATVHYFAAHVSLYQKRVRSEQGEAAFEGLESQDAPSNAAQGQAEDSPGLIEHEVEVETEHPESDVVFTPITAGYEADSEEELHADTTESDPAEIIEDEAETVAEAVYEAEADEAPAYSADLGSDEEEGEDTQGAEAAEADGQAEPAEAWADDEEEAYFDDEDYLALEEEREITSETTAGDAPEARPQNEPQPASAPQPAWQPPSEPIRQREAEERLEVTKEIVIEEKEVSLPEAQAVPAAEAPEADARPLSINEMLAAQLKGNKPNYQPGATKKPERPADIKSIISLNDKLLFIKDLFNGYSLAYSEAVELLNRYDDLESSKEFLQSNYAAKNNWEQKPDTVDKLYAILEKRFA